MKNVENVAVQWITNVIPAFKGAVEDELEQKCKLFREVPAHLAALNGLFGEVTIKIWLDFRGFYVDCWRDRDYTTFMLRDADADMEGVGLILFKGVKCVNAEKFEEYGERILSFLKGEK